MESGSSKKRRRADSEADPVLPEPTPIIKYSSAGLQPDVRLNLFGKYDIHCHSLILKLHSNYFRTFLDSADKTPAPASSLFKYDYITVVDEDKTWALEPAAKAPAFTNKDFSPADEHRACEDRKSFRKLLCAMYNRPYTVADAPQLISMIRLADFYCALPILSATIVGGLLESPIVRLHALDETLNELRLYAHDLLVPAKKLRNRALFRECLVHVAADYPVKGELAEQTDCDPEISGLVAKAANSIRAKILDVNQRLLLCLLQSTKNPQLEAFRKACTNNKIDEYLNPRFGPTMIPDFYRNLNYIVNSPEFRRNEKIKELGAVLKDLLVNNLTLDKTGLGPGEGCFNASFLCGNVGDGEMPWDEKGDEKGGD